MESLKVKTVFTLLEDVDFDIPTLVKLQSTISTVIDKKYNSLVKDFYLGKVDGYTPADKEASKPQILLDMLAQANFERRTDFTLCVEYGIRRFTIERFKEHKIVLRMFGYAPMIVTKTADGMETLDVWTPDPTDRLSTTKMKPYIDFAKFLLAFSHELALITDWHDFSDV